MAELKRRLGWATITVLVVLMLAALSFALLLGRSWGSGSGSSSPTISEIQELGELVVLRVNVADVLEDSTDDYTGVWIVRGDALVAIDMQLAELESTDEATKELVVRLQQPRVIQPRLDHERTTTYDVSKKTWWNPFVDGREEFSDQAMLRAQEIIESTAASDDIMDQARDQAELTLTNMYQLVGWKIDVIWQD